MKKLLFILAISMISLGVFAQEREVITISTGGHALPTAINAEFTNIGDSLKAALDTIRMQIDTTEQLRAELNAAKINLGGQNLNSAVTNPGLAQDQLYLQWDNINNEYRLAAAASEGSADSSWVSASIGTLDVDHVILDGVNDSIILARGHLTGITTSDNDAINFFTSGGTKIGIDGNGLRTDEIQGYTSGAINITNLGSDDTEDHVIAIDDATGLITKRSVASIGAGGGASAFDDLSDVTISGPSNNDILTYNSTGGYWQDVPMSGDASMLASGAITISDDAVQMDDLDATGTAGANTILHGNGSWSAIDLANDVTGLLPLANMNTTELDARYSLAADSIVTVYREGITATESVTGDTVFVGWDSTAVYAEIDTKKDIDDAELVFGLSFGVGNAGDTIIFQNGNIIYAVEWDGDYSLTITEVTVDAYHATLTPDIDIALLSAATFRDGSPVDILSADITVTATEQNITSFNDAVIEPGEWFMIRIDESTVEPTQLSISIDGTKQ